MSHLPTPLSAHKVNFVHATLEIELTNDEAVGPSNIPNSSGVKPSIGITRARSGMSRRTIMGKPIAAKTLINTDPGKARAIYAETYRSSA